jgi:hypothetical protein
MTREVIEAICCGDCVFYEIAEDVGRCRCHAPRITSANDEHGKWPIVDIEDWCGEYRGKNNIRTLVMSEKVKAWRQ